MQAVRFRTLLLCLSIGLAAQAAMADGWSLDSLNPFAKKDPKSASRTVSSQRSRQPSTTQQITRGAKKVVTGATDLVTLKWLVPKEESKKSSQPRLYDRRSTKHAKEQSSPGLFGSLFGPKEPEQPKSLSEWMAQKRPEP